MIGFDNVIKMTGGLVSELKRDQTIDDDTMEYCAVPFDTADDNKKSLESSIPDLIVQLEKKWCPELGRALLDSTCSEVDHPDESTRIIARGLREYILCRLGEI